MTTRQHETWKKPSEALDELNEGAFVRRHLGPRENEIDAMLTEIGYGSLASLVDAAVPSLIRASSRLDIGQALEESEALDKLKSIMAGNRVLRSLMGMGYSDTLIPPVIQRNILENPGWYTQYTPYQAEISQGRLEALLNFQTLIADLTGLEVANSSLLDEATAAAEAMAMFLSVRENPEAAFFVSDRCHPQTLAVVRTRAEALGVSVLVGSPQHLAQEQPIFGALLQYPDTFGTLVDYGAFIDQIHARGGQVVVAADLLSLCLLRPPGEFGADVVVGSSQRFGVPLGYGGPHAAFLSCRDEFKRKMPGRIVGVSKDAEGRQAIRLALQTREQHIRRDKATSNICTAQVLLAIMAAMYAIYHGPEGLRRIAGRVHSLAATLAAGLRRLGFSLVSEQFFDTVTVEAESGTVDRIMSGALAMGMNFRKIDATHVSVALDEKSTLSEVEKVLRVFAESGASRGTVSVAAIQDKGLLAPGSELGARFLRKSAYLQHPVFNRYHSETEMLRYIKRLEAKDLSLTTSMIPLGSCTMKLNATAEMYPVSWPEVSQLHPFVPLDQARGYMEMFRDLERLLAELTGYDAVSLQPNAGSQGEYAGLLVIREYLREKGQGQRDVCLIPQSAHGTNPASAVMAGMKVVVVRCDDHGNVDLGDLKAKVREQGDRLAALMVTYPSTHGVFERPIREICELIHGAGGQVYMDGANMNAQIGLCRPGDYGPDVIHLNLHKTFCIPHGGGGPGMGPICVKEHLAPYLPSHPVVRAGGEKGIGPVSAAPWGSPSILPIPWMYIRMMGGDGLTRATEVAILNANYIAKRVDPHFPVLYRGNEGLVAHECIVDLRSWKAAGIEVEDVAKRLMDYGFHAPTMSFPVAGTLMIEPTESESKAELDRFCDALIAIRGEIQKVADGIWDKKNNPLKNAPHTARAVTATLWDRPYTREEAAFPAPWTREHKFWPPVGRVDNVYGDRHLVCACPPIEAYQEVSSPQ